MYQGRFRLDVKKNFFAKKVVNSWNRMPRALVESPALEEFKRLGGVVLRDVV